MPELPPMPEQPDMSPKEVARLSNVSYWTVLEEIKRGNLVAYRRPGNKLAIRHDDFRAWAYGERVQPEPVDYQPRPSARTPRRERNASVARVVELERRRNSA